MAQLFCRNFMIAIGFATAIGPLDLQMPESRLHREPRSHDFGHGVEGGFAVRGLASTMNDGSAGQLEADNAGL